LSLPPRIERAIPLVAALTVSALLFVPFIPLWVKAMGVFALVGAAVHGRMQLAELPDHAALAASQQERAQSLLEAAMRGEGEGHALHLRSGDGTDDHVESMLGEALRDTKTPVLGVTTLGSATDGFTPDTRYDWHQAVPRVLDRARVIVLTPMARTGLRWEFSALRGRGLLDRTVLRMPPRADTPDAAARWEEARRLLLADGLHLPPYNPAGRWFRLCPDRGEPVGGAPHEYAHGLAMTIEGAHAEELPDAHDVCPIRTISQAA
jgi:hypothetical protein